MTFQIGSVLLDACVLAILAKEDTYGYRLTQQIKETLGVSESTLYPVLRRLQKEELLETYGWQGEVKKRGRKAIPSLSQGAGRIYKLMQGDRSVSYEAVCRDGLIAGVFGLVLDGIGNGGTYRCFGTTIFFKNRLGEKCI